MGEKCDDWYCRIMISFWGYYVLIWKSFYLIHHSFFCTRHHFQSFIITSLISIFFFLRLWALLIRIYRLVFENFVNLKRDCLWRYEETKPYFLVFSYLFQAYPLYISWNRWIPSDFIDLIRLISYFSKWPAISIPQERNITINNIS